MATEIQVEATFLVHSSGTKFYETVRLSRCDSTHSILVRRWGKMRAAGEVKFEVGDPRMTSEAMVKILTEKRKRGYSGSLPPDVFSASHNRTVSVDSLVLLLQRHYTAADRNAILAHLGLGYEEAVAVDEEYGVIVEEPAIDHGSDWATW